jgi:hypothetical protein
MQNASDDHDTVFDSGEGDIRRDSTRSNIGTKIGTSRCGSRIFSQELQRPFELGFESPHLDLTPGELAKEQDLLVVESCPVRQSIRHITG